MDYKYITQLLERYWNCTTSLEEDQIPGAIDRAVLGGPAGRTRAANSAHDTQEGSAS